MIRARRLAAALAAVAVTQCGARTELPCLDGPCPEPVDEDDPARACEGALSEPPPCTGSGLVSVLEDDCIDDSGDGGTGDRLEIYCVEGVPRFCLSHEQCPWRAGVSTSAEVTCSRSGLHSSTMANTIHGCSGWAGNDVYCCSPEGRMGVGSY